MKNDVLFITDKWVDGNPNGQPSGLFNVLMGTLESTSLWSSITMSHFDEFFHTYKTHYDNVIEKILDEYTPTVAVVSHIGDSFLNPTNKTYEIIKRKNIKLVFMWPDTRMWVPDSINQLAPFANLHISFCSEKEDNDILCKNHIWMWAPADPRLFYDDTKSVDVSFIGSLQGYNGSRLDRVNFLLQNGVNLKLNGGQRERKLTDQEYAKCIRTSKINLNFSDAALSGIHQCKGRVFEVISSNSFLLENENYATRRRLIPNVHYVEYKNNTDLKDKIEYFLKNEAERKEISQNAYDILQKKYSANVFWNTIFDKIK